MVVISGSHALIFFYYSLYCKSSLIQGANKVVVADVVAIENTYAPFD